MARVLVADDEPDILQAITAELEGDGHEVVAVPDGDAVVAAAIEHSIEVVLLDLSMVRVDGFETLRALAANPDTRDIPALVLSARGKPDDRTRAKALGACDYINKPWDTGEIQIRIQMALTGARRRAEALAERPAPGPPAADPSPVGTVAARRRVVQRRRPAERVRLRGPVRIRRRVVQHRAAAVRRAPATTAPAPTGQRLAEQTVARPAAGRFAVQIEGSVKAGALPPPGAGAGLSVMLRPIEDPGWVMRVDTFDLEAAAKRMGDHVYTLASGMAGQWAGAVHFALLTEWELADENRAQAFEANRRHMFETLGRQLPGFASGWLYRTRMGVLKYTSVALFGNEESWLATRSQLSRSLSHAAENMFETYGATELYGSCPCLAEAVPREAAAA